MPQTNMKSGNNLPVILAVDDDPPICETFQTIFEDRFRVLTAHCARECLDTLASTSVDLVFLDLMLPDMAGLDVLRAIKEIDDDLSVVVATAVDSARTAVEAMQAGACNYITKPFDVDEVLAIADNALEHHRLLKEIAALRSQRIETRFENIVGKSKKMKEVYSLIEKVLGNDTTVLISGESGTGKELIARAIHCNSQRRQKPFIPLNCASIPENLLESELFGHEKGAFTDAGHQKLGMFELADEGTLFLDEISTLRMETQAKLLRVLEEKEIKRVGGTKIIKVDVRILAATNTDLIQAVEKGEFRPDLYYRLNIVPVHLPPLRERREDIPLLAWHFLRRYNKKFRKDISGICKEAMQCLKEYSWPGNVRELKNIVERIVALKDSGIISISDLPFDVFIKNRLSGYSKSEQDLKQACRDFEREYIKAVLEKVGGNQVKAAQVLGLHRNGLANKMKSLGLKG